MGHAVEHWVAGPDNGVMNAASTPVLLLTGFEPFASHAVNESWQIAQALHGAPIGAFRVQAEQLPCVFGRSRERLEELMERWQPVVTVCLGLAASRHEISVERVALNIDDARIPDNDGRQPIDQPIVADGPIAHWSRLPIKRIVSAVRAAGWPAAVSQSAGTYVCNHVFYGLMQALERAVRQPGRLAWRGGFIHVPAVGTAWPAPASDQRLWTLEDLTAAVRLALASALDEGPDLSLTGGQVD